MTLHPLEQTFARFATLDERYRSQLRTEPDDQPGWLSMTELASAETTHLDDILARVRSHRPSDSRQPAVTLWFGHYAFAMMAVAIGCYLTEQRVPDLTSDNIWTRFNTDGDPEVFAWRGRVFSALEDDPQASHPDCIVLPSQDALREHLRNCVIEHLAPIVEALRTFSSIGKPALWALAADSSASAFTWIARLMGNQSIGVEEARMFNAAPSLLYRKRDFIQVEHCGLNHAMTDRLSCCLYYKVEGGNYCTSCPHRPHDEKIARIKKILEKRAAEQAEVQQA